MGFPAPELADPVVITGVPTHRGSDPGAARLRNVGGSGAEMRFQEWDYLSREHGDDHHRRERIPYLAINAGHHALADGVIWEAGTFVLSGTGSWQSVDFDEAFPGRPRLFLTVQTANGAQLVVPRARKVTAEAFEAALFEEQALNDGHLGETVGYLAVHAPRDAGFVAAEGRERPFWAAKRELDHRWAKAMDAELMLQEEESADAETAHRLAETIDVLQIGGGLFAQDVSSNGADPISIRSRYRPPGEFAGEHAERFRSAYRAAHGRSIEEALAHHKVAGLSVVLIKDKLPPAHLTWGLRNLRRDWPTTGETVYQAASLSKFVASLGFAAADRLGDLPLDETVEDFAQAHPSAGREVRLLGRRLYGGRADAGDGHGGILRRLSGAGSPQSARAGSLDLRHRPCQHDRSGAWLQPPAVRPGQRHPVHAGQGRRRAAGASARLCAPGPAGDARRVGLA